MQKPRIRYARNNGRNPEFLYLSDMTNFCVHLAMPDGKILQSFGTGQGFRPDQFQQPAGLTIDCDGNFIIAGKTLRFHNKIRQNQHVPWKFF